MTPQHSRAVANIKFALTNRDSFVIITGEIGIGKTTVVNTVLDDLGPKYVTAKLTHTTLSTIELLQALLSAFGMPNYTKKKVLLLDTLRDFFLKMHKSGKHVVIIVDEAQNLSGPALEELRLLSCIDNDEGNLVSIVLTGQPDLDDLLDAPDLAQLRQRARLRQRLEAMTEKETFDYLQHRLSIASGDVSKIFDPHAIREVFRLSAGIPRLINTLCDTALMSCMVEGESKVTLETIDAVVDELRWQWLEKGTQSDSAKGLADDHSGATQPAALTISRAGQVIQEILLRDLPFTIGRRSSNKLVLLDRDISQRHALINCASGIYIVEDLNSTNGVFVNGQRRTHAVLRDGDQISIGKMEMVFNMVGGEEVGGGDVPDSDHQERDSNVIQMDAVEDDAITTKRSHIKG